MDTTALGAVSGTKLLKSATTFMSGVVAFRPDVNKDKRQFPVIIRRNEHLKSDLNHIVKRFSLSGRLLNQHVSMSNGG